MGALTGGKTPGGRDGRGSERGTGGRREKQLRAAGRPWPVTGGNQDRETDEAQDPKDRNQAARWLAERGRLEARIKSATNIGRRCFDEWGRGRTPLIEISVNFSTLVATAPPRWKAALTSSLYAPLSLAPTRSRCTPSPQISVASDKRHLLNLPAFGLLPRSVATPNV